MGEEGLIAKLFGMFGGGGGQTAPAQTQTQAPAAKFDWGSDLIAPIITALAGGVGSYWVEDAKGERAADTLASQQAFESSQSALDRQAQMDRLQAQLAASNSSGGAATSANYKIAMEEQKRKRVADLVATILAGVQAKQTSADSYMSGIQRPFLSR